MHTIKGWLQSKTSSSTVQNNITTIDLEKLLVFLLSKDRAWLFAHPEHVLSANQVKQLNQWYDMLLDDLPVAYITGQQDFWDLKLQVNQHTLVPRPDTELLVELAIEQSHAPQKILDLGTGSGAIGLALAKTFPQAHVVAVDVAPEALEMARLNARNNQVSNIEFKVSHWFSALSSQSFDLIVSNPPYIASDDEHLPALRHEPLSALVAGVDGLQDFELICQQAAGHMTAHGKLLFEHGWQQKEAVQSILRHHDFQTIQTFQDLAGHDRVTLASSPATSKADFTG